MPRPIVYTHSGQAINPADPNYDIYAAQNNPVPEGAIIGENSSAAPPTAGLAPADPSISRYDDLLTQQENYYNSITVGTKTPEQLRQEARAAAQAQIDAINQVYAGLINTEQVQGERRSGQTGAMNARAGLLGSDFGAANQERTTQYNNQQIKALNDEKTMKIQEIFAEADKVAAENLRQQKEDAKYKFETGQSLLKGQIEQDERKLAAGQKRAADTASLGVNLKDLSESDYKMLMEQAGYTSKTTFELWYDSQKPKAEQTDWETPINLGGGTVLFYGKDSKGNLVKMTEKYDIGKDEKPTIIDGQAYVFTKDENGETIAKKLKGIDEKDESKDVVKNYATKYPDAGIMLTDDLATAQKKLAKSALWRKEIRVPANGNSSSNYKLSQAQKSAFIALGFSNEDLNNLEKNLKNNSLDAIAKVSGWSEEEITKYGQILIGQKDDKKIEYNLRGEDVFSYVGQDVVDKVAKKVGGIQKLKDILTSKYKTLRKTGVSDEEILSSLQSYFGQQIDLIEEGK